MSLPSAQSIFGISLPIVLNIIPKAAPITVVVGAPIDVPKVADPSKEQVRTPLHCQSYLTSSQVQEYLQIYIDALSKVGEGA